MIFKLRYKEFGGPKEVLFDCDSYESARALAQKYCKKFNYKFIIIAPFLTDIEGEIKKKEDEEFAHASKKVVEKKQQTEARKQNELAGLNDIVNELGKKKTA